MKTYLKVKICSLAAEARIIRRLELIAKRRNRQRFPGTTPPDQFWGLREHRIKDVRRESRSAGLAYGFLRSRSYDVMESERTRSAPDLKRVAEIAAKFGTADKRITAQSYEEWETLAKSVYKVRAAALAKEDAAYQAEVEAAVAGTIAVEPAQAQTDAA